jgi:hypothetical protein
MAKRLNLDEIPVGNLITEHRLIERYIGLMRKETIQNLNMKNILPEHKKVIDELVLEHIRERRLVDALEIAKDNYWLGRREFLKEILKNLKSIVEFYPGHMEREEKSFFLPSMGYFSKKEQGNMLQEFAAFDQKLVHEIYSKMADEYEGFPEHSDYGDRTVQLIEQPSTSFLSDDSQESPK